MAASTHSIRLSDALVADARHEAKIFNRTISGQVEHWARLGQAVEAAPGFDLTRVRAALDGRFNADLLSSEEREYFEDLMALSFLTPSAKSVQFAEMVRHKTGAVGLDDAGRLVRNLPDGGVEIIKEADG